ncbi:hypothetical protein LTR10_009386 [Elasticomyces elasticus]|nr:hypothetical protein LTR10_009386 [Elasticomyces elasticus]KAK4971515.1 hypothetical protein LTR42_007243 [Elasticomyces elasticus]
MNSPLLSLPAELRNSINEMVILQTKIVKVDADGYLTNQPGLLAVCHQLRNEALPVFQSLAPTVARRVFEVHNLDFGGLMTYIGTLDEAQRDAIGRRRKLLIKITLDNDYYATVTQNVLPWIRYCTTELSSHLELSYYAREAAYEFVGKLPPMAMVTYSEVDTAIDERDDALELVYPLKEIKRMSLEWDGIKHAWAARLQEMHRRYPTLPRWNTVAAMEQSSSLTTIAPELRNSIFGLALQDVAEEVGIASSGRPMKQPGLLAVCHHIRYETLPVLQDLVARSAKRVVVPVHEFDFSTAMKYIDDLTREQRDVVGDRASLLLKVIMDETKDYKEFMSLNLHQ